MEEYSAEDGLRLLNLARIFLPSNEVEMFKSQFKDIYDPSGKGYNFVDSIWKIYSEILPFKAHSDEGENDNFLRHLARDNLFQHKVIDSGIADKLKFVSLNDLVKDPPF